MVDEIIKEIQLSEKQAVDLIADSRKQAREIQNQSSQDAKAQSDRILDEAKQKAQAILNTAEQNAKAKAQQYITGQSNAIDKNADKARENIDAAVRLILERVC